MAKDNGKVLIHGKEYETVASRVNKFRTDKEIGRDFSIETEIVEANDQSVTMKAIIRNKESRVIATGYAEESRASSSINRTSALENCETSAIGRALAAFGMAGTEYATADEVSNAIQQQAANKSRVATDDQKVKIKALLAMEGVETVNMPQALENEYKIKVGSVMTYEQAEFIINDLTGKD